MAEFDEALQVVRDLMAEDGCPWDRAQTHETLKAPCIEEAAEVVCAVNILKETGNAENLKEELGDLLMQVLMNAVLAEKEGLFTIDDVCRALKEKLIRRHPHIFGTEEQKEARGRDADEALRQWNEIKKLEKKGKTDANAYLPAAFDEAEELINVARKRKGFI